MIVLLRYICFYRHVERSETQSKHIGALVPHFAVYILRIAALTASVLNDKRSAPYINSAQRLPLRGSCRVATEEDKKGMLKLK